MSTAADDFAKTIFSNYPAPSSPTVKSPENLRYPFGTTENDPLFQPLTEADLPLLSTLAKRNLSPGELIRANQLLQIGSMQAPQYSSDTRENHPTIDSITSARYDFFETVLGFKRPTHPLHGAYQSIKNQYPTITPIDTFVATQRFLAGKDLNGEKLLRSTPLAFQLTADKIRATVIVLEKNNLNPQIFINKNPNIITFSPHTLTQKIHALSEIGIDSEVLRRSPTILSLSVATVDKKRALLTDYSIDFATIIRRFPQVLTLSEDNLKNSVGLLNSKGITKAAIEKYPTILGLSAERVEKRIILIDQLLDDCSMSVSAIELLNLAPVFFGHAEARLHAMFTFIKFFAAKRPKPLQDSAEQLNRFSYTPIDSLFAFIIERGYFGKNSRNGSMPKVTTVDREAQMDLIVKALVSPEKLREIGRPTIIAYLHYACKNDPAELERMLNITETLQNSLR